MKNHTTRTIVLSLAFVTGIFMVIASIFRRGIMTSGQKTLPVDLATDYETALTRLAQVQAFEAKLKLNPNCRTKLLTHGSKVERVIILMHGMTNCPQQYVELAPKFYEMGYNVLIPRIPHNGLADRMTDDLKFLTAKELRECSNTMVDIARGLGEYITFAGLSAGGLMAAWVAQYRPDVDKAILIAPSFTISSRQSMLVSYAVMLAFLVLPNILTERFMPFKDGPDHSYLGFSTRALGQMMSLGFSILRVAKKTKPATSSVLLITNASDPVVNNKIPMKLVNRWRAKGLARFEAYEFSAEHQLIHDIIDPQQSKQQTSLVYPVLFDLFPS